MPKKSKYNGIEEFVSPLVKKLFFDFGLINMRSGCKLHKDEIAAIKAVERSGGLKLLVYSYWDGAGSKNWQISCIDNNNEALEEAAADMVSATDKDEVYYIKVFDMSGNEFDLSGRAVKVEYSLNQV